MTSCLIRRGDSLQWWIAQSDAYMLFSRTRTLVAKDVSNQAQRPRRIRSQVRLREAASRDSRSASRHLQFMMIDPAVARADRFRQRFAEVPPAEALGTAHAASWTGTFSCPRGDELPPPVRERLVSGKLFNDRPCCAKRNNPLRDSSRNTSAQHFRTPSVTSPVGGFIEYGKTRPPAQGATRPSPVAHAKAADPLV